MLAKKILSQKGSALVYAMVGSLAVAGLGLVFLQRSQTEQRIASKYKADSDVDTAMLEITSKLLMPQNCNATFRGVNKPPFPPAANLPQTGGVQLTELKVCTSGNCSSGSSTSTFKPVVTTAGEWKATVTKFPGSTSAGSPGDSIVRLVSAMIFLNKDQYHSGGNGYPAEIRLDLIFEKKIGTVGSNAELKTSRVARSIFIPVLTGTYNGSSTLTPSTSILGCPRTPNATQAY